MLRGNKGEWSEFYTLIKLLSERHIFGADENLNKVQEVLYPIVKIIREETSVKIEYELDDTDQLKIDKTDQPTSIVNISELSNKTVKIFDAIKNSEGASFEIPAAEELLNDLNVSQLNAGNSQKEDLVIKIYDMTTGGLKTEVGFSIKSQLGAPASLVNASKATNFIYKIYGIDDSIMEEINSINTQSKIRDRVSSCIEQADSFIFESCSSEIFTRNMRRSDTALPEILAYLLVDFYLSRGPTVEGVVTGIDIDALDIGNFNIDVSDIRHKVGDFLRDAALGMVPSTVWDGNIRASGGYLIVKEDGEIVCYHIYNADAFREYLIKNTKFETGGTTKHEFGKIYKENGEFLMKLNLQIRFLK